MTPIFWAALLIGSSVLFVAYLLSAKKRIEGELSSIQIKIEEEEGRCNLQIVERSRLEQKEQTLLRKKARYFQLREAVRGLSYTSPPDVMASQLALRASELAPKGESCFLFLLRDDREHFDLAARRDRTRADAVSPTWMDIFHQWILQHRQPLLIEDVEKEYRLQIPAPLLKNADFPRSLIAVPLVTEDKILGILSAVSSKKKEFSIDDLRPLAILSSSAALLLANARLYQETVQLANRDGLTRLFLPRVFREKVEAALSATHGKPANFSILMMDLDYFREVNNKHGHLVGDALLVAVAQLLRKFSPQEGVLCRYGGEEFAMLLPGYNKKEAGELAERLRGEIAAAKVVLRRKEFQVTISMGVATFPEDGLQREELIEKADQALYQAKNRGRNQVVSV